jgi:hypothetical protein
MNLPEGPNSAPAAANRWGVPPEDFRRLLAGPVLCRLADHTVLEFDGVDAPTFLQGQTTADILAMAEDSWQLGGYCTPKGRLLAIFQAWREASTIRMILPAAIAPAVLRRLTQYILRSKLRARDAGADWTVLGLCGAGSAKALQEAGLAAPLQAWRASAIAGGGRIACLPAGAGCAERFLCVLPAARAAQWLERLAALPVLGPELWWWSQIEAAVPAVVAGTAEWFVPQTVNLEVLGGVSFRKGCYPGQEVVARSQYLGKLRRRMALAHAPELGPAPDIFASGRSEPVGRIVLAASAPEGGWDLLYESAESAGAEAALHAGSAQTAPMIRRALPYVLFDPTA